MKSKYPNKLKTMLLVFVLLLCLSLTGCVRAEKVKDKVEVPAFTIMIDDTMYTASNFADLPIYECKATSTNNYGTEETYVYTGYQLGDVLETVKANGSKGVIVVGSDGYESDFTAKETTDSTTLMAFLRNGKPSSENGTVFVAPCKSDSSPDYVKNVAEIMTNAAA